MRALFLPLLLTLFVLLGMASASESDMAAIKALVAQRNELFNAQEYDRLVPLFAKDKQAARAAGIAKQKDKWKAKGLVVSKAVLGSVELDGDKAVAVQTFELDGAAKTETLLLVKEPDGWKISEIRQ